jgi:hypothetical protein
MGKRANTEINLLMSKRNGPQAQLTYSTEVALRFQAPESKPNAYSTYLPHIMATGIPAFCP